MLQSNRLRGFLPVHLMKIFDIEIAKRKQFSSSAVMSSAVFRVIQSTKKISVVRLLSASYSAQAGVKEQIDKLVKEKKVVVFMKGTPDAPRCGFSNAVVQILKFHGVDDYSAHDVLADDSLRQGEAFKIVKTQHNVCNL